ncbi:MAG: DUF975 family protein [bacterium]
MADQVQNPYNKTGATAAPIAPSPVASAPVSGEYPGILKLFRPSRQAVGLVFWSLVVLSLFSGGISFAIGVFFGFFLPKASSLNNLTQNVITVLFAPAFALILLMATRGQKTTATDAFKYAVKNFVRFFIASFLVGLLVLAGLIVLVIPGIYIGLRLSLVQYILIDNPTMGAVDALKQSWSITKGNFGKIFVVSFVNFLMIAPPVLFFLYVALAALSEGAIPISGSIIITGGIFSALWLVVAIIPAIMYLAALPLVYLYIVGTKKPEAKAPALVPPTPPVPTT